MKLIPALAADILARNIVYTIAHYEADYNHHRSSDKIWTQEGRLFCQKDAIFSSFSSVTMNFLLTDRTYFVY